MHYFCTGFPTNESFNYSANNDKVIGQNGINTLPVLAVLLFTFLFENVLTAVRTNLFIDTTNRIDLSLGEEIIDHLLRLPLTYFDKRPVGELS